MLVAEAVLRLLGAVYALGALAALRRATVSALLDAAIAAIGAADRREQRAALWRSRWLMAAATVAGLGGIALALLLTAALPLFVAAAAMQAGYYAYLAPRLLDPWDKPDAEERRAGWRAFLLHLGATGLVAVAWLRGALLPAVGDGWSLLAAGLLGAALLGFALRQTRTARSFTGPGLGFAIEPRRSGLLLMPGWDGVPLHDAATGEALEQMESDISLTREEFAAAEAWLALFVQLADPDDPWRCALKDPADAARLDAAGRPIFEQLRQRLGDGAVTFSPLPRPQRPRVTARRVRVATEAGEPPLWSLDREVPGPFDPDLFGISHALAAALLDWAAEFDAARDWKAPGQPPPWTEAEWQAHAARGEALARRLATELATTGRADVVVTVPGPDGQETRILP